MASRKTYFGIGFKDPNDPESGPAGAGDPQDRSQPTVVDDEKVAEGLRQLRSWYSGGAQPAATDPVAGDPVPSPASTLGEARRGRPPSVTPPHRRHRPPSGPSRPIRCARRCTATTSTSSISTSRRAAAKRRPRRAAAPPSPSWMRGSNAGPSPGRPRRFQQRRPGLHRAPTRTGSRWRVTGAAKPSACSAPPQSASRPIKFAQRRASPSRRA